MHLNKQQTLVIDNFSGGPLFIILPQKILYGLKNTLIITNLQFNSVYKNKNTANNAVVSTRYIFREE